MVDAVNPWEGVTQPAEKEAEVPLAADRRRPGDEQALNAALVLAGLRGAKKDAAVRFRDLDRLEQQVVGRIDPLARQKIDEIAGSIAAQLTAQVASINADSERLVTSLDQAFQDAREEIARLANYQADLSISFTKSIGSISATLQQDYYTIAQTDTAIAAVQTNLNSAVGSINANLSANYYTRAGTDGAISTAFNTLSTTVNGNTSSISSLTSSQNGIKAVHAIEIDNNGYISGFGLISELIDGDPVADFIIRDASFRLVNSSGSGSGYTPFAVYPSGRTVNGAFIPAGVHAEDLYVTRANIGQLAVDTLRIADNAVTIPVTGESSTRTGSGFFISMVSFALTLPEEASILMIWSLKQSYTGTPAPSWEFRLRDTVSGTIYDGHGGTAVNDAPSGQAAILYQPAGVFRCALEWKGANSNIEAIGSLTMLAVKK